jgi:probable addiction module antidote protein
MSEIAEATGLGRESLYKSLRADAQPRFDTVQRVLAALGLKLTVEPAEAA